MSKIRRGPLPTDRFTIISNDWMRDTRLSFAARGLLAWLAGHADGYDVTEAAIIAAGPDGRGAVRTMTEALEKAGYLRRERTYNVEGGSAVDYVLTDPREGENCLPGKGQNLPPRSDQGQQDLFAGQPEGQNLPPRSYPEDQKKTKTPSVSRRATRIPDNFQPTDEMKTWFREQGYTDLINGPVEHAQFVDYWTAKAGADACKLDWPATWRRWMRTAAERRPRRPGNALSPVSGAPLQYKPSTTDQRVMQGISLVQKYRQMEEEQ